MNADFLRLLSTTPPGGDLEFSGARDGDELLDGTLLCDGQQVGEVVDGVACFCEDNWLADKVSRIMTDDWLAAKWRDKAANAPPIAAAFCDELAARDGVILEIAAGPGGGNLQGVLHRNPGAKLIVNDTSRGVLLRWRRFMLERKLAENVSFAAFDAGNMVLRDATIAAVSGVAAFGNIGGREVFEETFRVMRPGGALYSSDMVVDPDDWRRLPDAFRAEWEAHTPGFTCGIAGLLVRAGFVVERRESLPGRALNAAEDGIQEKADQYGVTLHVVFEYIEARKPS